jgi:hypothetical protein
LRLISFTTRSAGTLEFARFDLIFVPYSHYDETKTLLYPTTSICLTKADGEQVKLVPSPEPQEQVPLACRCSRDFVLEVQSQYFFESELTRILGTAEIYLRLLEI